MLLFIPNSCLVSLEGFIYFHGSSLRVPRKSFLSPFLSPVFPGCCFVDQNRRVKVINAIDTLLCFVIKHW